MLTLGAKISPVEGGQEGACSNSRVYFSHLDLWGYKCPGLPGVKQDTFFEEMPRHALPRILSKTQPLFSLIPFFVAREPTRAKTPTSKVVTGECSGQERAKSHTWHMPVPSVASALPGKLPSIL